MASSNTEPIHNGSDDITIVRGTVDAAPAVLGLLDSAVKWLVARDGAGQWGSAPFSENPRRVEQLEEFATTGHGLWLAVVKAADDAPTMGKTQPTNMLPPSTDGGAPRIVVGALAVGEKMPYVPPASEPELYVKLLVTDRRLAGKQIGKHLLEHARDLARGAGIALLRVDCYAGGNGKLVQYYESQGFKRLESMNLEGGWPCQVLAQRLNEVKEE